MQYRVGSELIGATPTTIEGVRMTNWRLGLVGLALTSLGFSALAAPTAQAAVLIIPRRARRAAAAARRARGGASGLRLERGPLRLAAPPLCLDARALRARAPRPRVGPGSLEHHEDHYASAPSARLLFLVGHLLGGHRGLLLAVVFGGLALFLIEFLAHRLRRFVTHGRCIMRTASEQRYLCVTA